MLYLYMQWCVNMRPTFWFCGKPVRAAGILVWTRSNGKTLRLMRKVCGRNEDLGGKTDAVDRDMMDTAIREAVEETDGKLFSNNHTTHECSCMLYRHIINCSDVQYNPSAKYLLYRVYVDPTILQLSMKRFGLYETTEWGILRHRFKWTSDVKNIHPRIRGMVR
mgnify:CR=1 FL=1